MLFTEKFDVPWDWKSVAAGVIGGAAGTLAMATYWQTVSRVTGSDPRKEIREEPGRLDDISVTGQKHREGEESATGTLARVTYEKVKAQSPDIKTRKRLSHTLHWGYGMATGGLYGAVRARRKDPDLTGGIVYGLLTWMIGDELAVPMLGLEGGPTRYPLRQHVHRLGTHVVFGIAAALTSQKVRRLLDTPRLTR